jgi:hypothetical protein
MSFASLRNVAILLVTALLALPLTITSAHAGVRAGAKLVSSGTTPSSEETFSASVGASNMTSVAGGTVTGAGSAPVAGAVIDLYAWPSDAVLMSMKIGAQVPTTLLATAITSKVGKYVLRVPMANLKAAAVESGYANLEITSTGGAVWFLSYQTSSPHAGPSAPVTVNVTAHGHLCGMNKDGEYYAGSPFVKLRQLKAAPAIVGQGYIGPVKTAGDSMDFEYDQTGTHSQTSTLGVGISAVGVSAGYTGGGTSTSTATGSEGFAGQTKNSLFVTDFSVGEFRSECYGFVGEKVPHEKQKGYCPRTFTNQEHVKEPVHKCVWQVKSTGWDAGAQSPHPKNPPSTPAKFCGGFQDPGSRFGTTNEKAVQWSKGFDIGFSNGIKGVSLNASYSSSAQTGYDSNAQIVYIFKHGGYACGTNHNPPKAAIVVMRGTKS